MSESVLLDVRDGVATITLNRPEAMNSLDVATKQRLLYVVEKVAADPSARAVLLTGSGRAFCVGQDLKEHVEILNSDRKDDLFRTVEEHYNPIVTALATMPKPVICAINGIAAGAGVSLALACDLRIMTEKSGFNFAFAGIALSCDTGVSWTLPRLVGREKTLELLYFPSTIAADQALAMGLVGRVVPAEDLLSVAGDLAERLARGPTVALGAMRRAVAYSAEHTFVDALAFEGEMMDLTGATQDHASAVASFLAKEKPTFQGH